MVTPEKGKEREVGGRKKETKRRYTEKKKATMGAKGGRRFGDFLGTRLISLEERMNGGVENTVKKSGE